MQAHAAKEKAFLAKMGDDSAGDEKREVLAGIKKEIAKANKKKGGGKKEKKAKGGGGGGKQQAKAKGGGGGGLDDLNEFLTLKSYMEG